MEGYLLPLVTEVGDAAVSHQDSTIWDSPKQEGSLDVRQKKTKQKSTTVLNCLEDNLPETPDPSRKRKNDCEIWKTEIKIHVTRVHGRVTEKEKETRSWPLSRNYQCSGQRNSA